MKLDSAVRGSTTLKIFGSLPNGNYWNSQCGLYGSTSGNQVWAFCEHAYKDMESTYTSGVITDFGDWHVFRIEIDPDSGEVAYYIDGNFEESILLENIDIMRFSIIL